LAVILSVSSSSVQLKAVKEEDEEEEAERGKANIVFSLEMEREEGGGVGLGRHFSAAGRLRLHSNIFDNTDSIPRLTAYHSYSSSLGVSRDGRPSSTAIRWCSVYCCQGTRAPSSATSGAVRGEVRGHDK